MAKKRKATPAESSTDQPSFEEALARLEEIVRVLEEGNLGLEESIRLYEEGVRQVRICEEKLTNAERRIELLLGVDSEGRARVQPFEESEMTLEEKQTQRSRRRSMGDSSD